MLTPAQRPKFFAAMHRAWLVHAMRAGLDARDLGAEDAWYRGEMDRLCGCRSIKNMDPLLGYDQMRLLFGQVTNNAWEIDHFSVAVERRYRHVIAELLRALTELEGAVHDWSYVRATYAHMTSGGAFPAEIEDADTELLWKVISALDTHRRRILAARGELATQWWNLGRLGSRRRRRERGGLHAA